MGRSEMLGVEEEPFNEDFKGFPLERMMGVEGVRGRDGVEHLEVFLEDEREGMNRERPGGGDEGEEVGKGTAEGGSWGGISMRGGGSTEGEKRPAFMERRRELMGA